MKESYETSIPKERERLQEQYEILESTDGFQDLSERQQRLLKASLYLQERAERLSDKASEQAVISKRQGYFIETTKILDEEDLKEMYKREPELLLNPETRKYRNSQNRIANWYCHASIYSLENEKIGSIKPEDIPDNFFAADYEKVEKIDDARALILESGFPSIVHISDDKNNFNDGWHQKHSFLALGKNEDGDIVLWEKEGFNLPFHITTLSQIYKDYCFGHYWGTRKLASDKIGLKKSKN